MQGNLSHHESISEACRRGKGAYLSLAGVGVRPKGLNPLTAISLYQAVIAKLLYGSELWYKTNRSDELNLERVQRFCAKVAQTFSPRAQSDIALAMVGLPRIEAFIARSKLLYLMRLLSGPCDSGSKDIIRYKVFLSCMAPDICKSRIVRDTTSLACQYKLDTDQYMIFLGLMKP